MPYILPKYREDFDKEINDIVSMLRSFPADFTQAGALNYVLSKIVVGLYPPESYTQISNAIAAFECAKLEYYRVLAGEYEEKKRLINGDIYVKRTVE
jgi:hypothetical protein